MKKVKLFVENFLVYGFGGIISKIIPLIMIPFITRIMPSTDFFGINDLSNTIVSFATAFAIMGMYDAMYRYFFERVDIEYKYEVCSTALLFTSICALIVSAFLIVFKEAISVLFFNDKQYAYLIYILSITTLVGSSNSIISAPSRMQNKRKIFLITNTISPVISYGISIPLLLRGYYIVALPIAGLISNIIITISFWLLNKKWFHIKMFNVSLLKQLLIIALPLMPNFLVYWIFNSSDKLMITKILGISAAGVYAVGSKLGNCSQLIYIAFAGGWQFFSFSTMNEKHQVKNNSLVFEYLGAISFSVTLFVCALSFPIYKMIFPEQYTSGYIVAPYLFLSPLLQMLFQISCNQFLIIKKTWPNIVILTIGAILNILLNYILIPKIGIEGASIATLLGYFVSVIICVFVLYKMNLIILRKKIYILSILLVVFMIIWRVYFLEHCLLSLMLAFLYIAITLFLYRKDILNFAKKSISKKS